MSDPSPSDPTGGAIYAKRSERYLSASLWPFVVAGISVVSIFILVLLPYMYDRSLVLGAVSESDSALVRFLIPNAINIGLFLIALFSTYVGYRLVVASGAAKTVVIPPEDRELLSSLVQEGKAESIDQYVRLSSLAKFTGTFTQLGLTGLPLATIGLTLFFSLLTLFQPEQFLDLTKLTLGAFIGSFVQRQIERRSDPSSQTAKESLDEDRVPSNTR